MYYAQFQGAVVASETSSSLGIALRNRTVRLVNSCASEHGDPDAGVLTYSIAPIVTRRQDLVTYDALVHAD